MHPQTQTVVKLNWKLLISFRNPFKKALVVRSIACKLNASLNPLKKFKEKKTKQQKKKAPDIFYKILAGQNCF